MSAHALPSPLRSAARKLPRKGSARSIIRTAGFNVASTVAAGLGGLIFARAVGPAIRGEYAAITSWFGLALTVGGMGQPAALCFYVASDAIRAREYVATSRVMMVTTGTIALVGGLILAPALSHGSGRVTDGYRIAFATSIIAFVGASYTFSLQARDIRRWNIVRLSQPALSAICMAVLWKLHSLTLRTALLTLTVTMAIQLIWAYRSCRATDLAPGRPRRSLVRPLAGYGTAQIAALAPATVNAYLDQLVLSQTVSSADLGRYAIAVSLTSMPIPIVSAIGNVAFPRLAARTSSADTADLQRRAVVASLVIAAAMLLPLDLIAYWAVPLAFGRAYQGTAPLIWLLTPGAVCLACSQVVGDLLRGRKRPTVVARAEGLAAVFTVVLLIVLLPTVGVAGAAIASTVAYGTALAVMLRSLHRPPPAGTSASRPSRTRRGRHRRALGASRQVGRAQVAATPPVHSKWPLVDGMRWKEQLCG